MQKELNTPTWNTSGIFPSLSSEEYKKFIEKYKNLLEQTKEHLTNQPYIDSDFYSWLKDYLNFSNQLSTHSKTLNAFAYLIYSVDTTNSEYLNNISAVDNLLIEDDQISLLFCEKLKENAEKLPSFFTENPGYKPYQFLLEQEITGYEHQMSQSEEKLAGELQQTGGNAWDRLHEQIISNLKDPQTGKTFNELRNDAYDSNPQVRFDSYNREIALLEQNEIAFAACLNNLKGETITLNRHRNYQTPLERTLESSRMSKETLDALISAIKKSLPEWQKYFIAKSSYLKKKKLTASDSTESGIAFFDLFAPISDNSVQLQESVFTKLWSFEEAIDYVILKFSSFSKDMGDFAKKAKENHWIDAKVRSGKVGGAYDEDIPSIHESRILTNFTGSFSDVITLAHELGHAYHFQCMKGQPSMFYDYPMTLAETASTFAETIVKQDIIKSSSSFTLLQALETDLQDVSQVLVDILCRYNFEKSVFESRQETELSAQDFNQLMLEAQSQTYGSGLNNYKHKYMWAVKSHYYSTSLDFYNFPYAFGQLFAMSLYQKYLKEGTPFTNTYNKILSMTGNCSCEELCKAAGFNIQSEDFWINAMAVYFDEIKLFTELTK